MNPVAAVFEIARQSTRLLLQTKMLRVVVVAEVALAAIAWGVAGNADPDLQGRHLFGIMAWWMLTLVLVPWTTFYFGVQAVHGDIEDRSFQYLFVRPVPRGAILLGKWLAVGFVAALVHSIGTLLVFGAIAMHDGLWPGGVDVRLGLVFAAAMWLQSFAYAAVAAMFSAMFRWPLIWGAGFVFGAQMLLANLPVRASIRYATITDPVRRFVLGGIDPDRELARIVWPAERHWRPELEGQPLLNLAILIAVALLLGLLSYGRSEYDSRPRE